MKAKTFIVLFSIFSINLFAQEKDTLFIILQDEVFSKAVNDTLVIDENVGWINQKKIGNYHYPEKSSGRFSTCVRKDTVLHDKKIIKGRYRISKFIYPSDIDYKKDMLKQYLKTIDSCDQIYKMNNEKDVSSLLKSRHTENKNRKEIYKCYHNNLKQREINFTPYSFWREDSKSDYTVIFDTIVSAKKDIIIKSDSRIYKNLQEIENICKQKNKNNIKCLKLSRSTYPNIGLGEFENLDLRNYHVYINEDFIPENFYSDEKKTKMIMFNEYHFNKNYHKYR